MRISSELRQNPMPGNRIIKFRGDVITFSLTAPPNFEGRPRLRTNIGRAAITRREIIRKVRHHENPLGRDWYDLPMRKSAPGEYRIALPLTEVGHFEAKCLFFVEGEMEPIWPEGANTVVNVLPADLCAANIVYNAFVRQFGPNKSGALQVSAKEADEIERLDKANYVVIPPSGTFRDLIRELEFIIGELGCRILQLLPIHPTPTTYGRMGRFGSPYAALSFTAVDPALAQFDPKATPMEQFIELVDAVHRLNAKVMLDIAINHTGWAAGLHESHPRWLKRDAEGRIEVPGAWGVRWEDLTALDYQHTDLWEYMADMFLTWCRRGVDGFRCDAGYMIPLEAWRYIVATVRDQFPDTIFLLEGLGGAVDTTRDILNLGNFDWAYSELFQNYDRNQIAHYLPEAMAMSDQDGVMIHFAETHDNPRLAARSHTYARMRTALCALFSQFGGFGFANGVEWLAAEKINVHGAPSLNWGSDQNQIGLIRRLCLLLKNHPAFHDQTDIRLVQEAVGNTVAMLRHNRPTQKSVLVLVNLDDADTQPVFWDPVKTGMAGPAFTDLVSGHNIIAQNAGQLMTFELVPGQVVCLSPDPGDLIFADPPSTRHSELPRRIQVQMNRAKALEVFQYFYGCRNLEGFEPAFDPDRAAADLIRDPVAYCRNLNPDGDEPRVITWDWPADQKREVMIPPGHFLRVKCPHRFRARIVSRKPGTDRVRVHVQEECLHGELDGNFALFAPGPEYDDTTQYYLRLSVFAPEGCIHGQGPLLFLPSFDGLDVRRIFGREDILNSHRLVLGTNGRGGMMRAHAAWGVLESRYDALLAANRHPRYPEDRWIMFARCRGWLNFQGFSTPLNLDCLERFAVDGESRGAWRFVMPCGQSEFVVLSAQLEMLPGKNAIRLVFTRQADHGMREGLADAAPIHLILRPDIEDRNFHETVKAFTGPETHWPASIRGHEDGFTFRPDPGRHLRLKVSSGEYHDAPEWQYMVPRPVETQRGLDAASDLFSPGYFNIPLAGGQSVELTAWVGDTLDSPGIEDAGWGRAKVPAVFDEAPAIAPAEALAKAIRHYMVRRGDLSTVIAGYPWFLDWGRDTLIFVRGLIASGGLVEARAILKQFARFEENGTIPNMIRGDDAGNRDTSDAPLWFFVAAADLIRAEGRETFWDEVCDERRSVRQIMADMAGAIIDGTPNGIRMDPESGLVYSPSHFTWMDTNYPAGTPRQGYPIEIQAFWHFALCLLARVQPREAARWSGLADQVRGSIKTLFWRDADGYLCDCRHAQPGQSAAQAEPDDALRPNQLFALTLDAVVEPDMCRRVLAACEKLLVPGAIRSLADQPVQRPLVVRRDGVLLNDPHHPYWGVYGGDEDTRRKPAYHNGTAWTWVFPSYSEAWFKTYGPSSAPTAKAWLASGVRLMPTGCVGHLPEILDGDAPHTARGCDAQAWGASELLRVLLEIEKGLQGS